LLPGFARAGQPLLAKERVIYRGKSNASTSAFSCDFALRPSQKGNRRQLGKADGEKKRECVVYTEDLLEVNGPVASATPPDNHCEYCGKTFLRRLTKGGSKKRFCSADCRKQFNNDQRLKDPPASQAFPPASQQKSPASHETLDTLVPKAAPEPPKFNCWRDPDLVVIPEQRRIAVYVLESDEDQVCIRQEGDDLYVDEAFVWVRRQNLGPLISRLQEIERGEP
jgi:hypothetical protein